MATLPASLLALAAGRHGVLRREELEAEGITRRRLDRLILRSVLERVGRGVYRICGCATSPDQDAVIACFDADGPLTHRAACAVHGLGGYRLDRFDGRPEVLIHEARGSARRRALTRAGFTVYDFTYREVSRDPSELLATVRSFLDEDRAGQSRASPAA